MTDTTTDLITDIVWEKLGPSTDDGWTPCRMTAKYDGHSLYMHPHVTDDFFADEEARGIWARLSILDFVKENPPA